MTCVTNVYVSISCALLQLLSDLFFVASNFLLKCSAIETLQLFYTIFIIFPLDQFSFYKIKSSLGYPYRANLESICN